MILQENFAQCLKNGNFNPKITKNKHTFGKSANIYQAIKHFIPCPSVIQ